MTADRIFPCGSGCIACAPLWERIAWGVALLAPLVWAVITGFTR